MIPSTRAQSFIRSDDETKTEGTLPPDQVQNDFDQEGEHEVQEQADGSAIVVPLRKEQDKDKKKAGEFTENLAEVLDEAVLRNIAQELIRLIEQDQETRSKRDEIYAEGLRRTGLGNDAPGGADFEGASKTVHPVLAEACVDFESRAIKELYPPNGPVKTNMIGQDRSTKRQQIADMKKTTLNWYLKDGAPEYKDELEQTLSQTPLGGSQFIKIIPDIDKNKISFMFVPVDDMFLSYASSSFYTSPRATHRQWTTKLEFEARTSSGLYREVKIDLTNEHIFDTSRAQEANDKIEGKTLEYYNDDGLRQVYESSVMYKIEEDDRAEGKAAPYIIHIDKATEQVLGVYRNWEEDDKYFKKIDWIVEFGLIPWRGAYKLGLPHLIGSLAGAATGALRALLDSAHISNSATVLKLAQARSVGQTTDIAITQVAELEGPPGIDDIRKLAMPMPFPGPSTVLFQLLGFLVETAKGVVTTAEEKIADANNQMPVGTSLALIEQGSKVYAAIHSRLHDSQYRLLKIVCRLLAQYPTFLEPAQKVLGERCASAEMFGSTDDISPVSDPNIFSEAQRFAQLQGAQQLVQAAPNLKWNLLELNRRALQLLNMPDPDGILPPPEDPFTGDPVNENSTAMLKGAPLKAAQEQDHLAHLREHLRFLCDPLQGASPIMPLPGLMNIYNHCSEHLVYLYVTHTSMVGSEVAGHMMSQGTQPNVDNLSAAAAASSKQYNDSVMQLIGQQMQQAAQLIKSKQPPQPMDPTQATLQASQAETQRQTQRDQAEIQLKAQAQKGEQEKSMQELQIQVQTTLQQLQDSQTQAQREFELRKEELRQGWVELEQKAAQLGMQNQNDIMQMLQTISDRMAQPAPPDPQEVTAPLDSRIDGLEQKLEVQNAAHDAAQAAAQDHNGQIMDLLKSQGEQDGSENV